ncbi:MAG: glutamate 5-kinase [Pseudomonadota bacterium]
MNVDLSAFKRLVVKVGSSLLVGDNDRIDATWLQSLARDIAFLKQGGADVLIVSSGAVAIGSRRLGIDKRRARLEELQAAAASGQIGLAHAWQSALSDESIDVAQVLLTPEDTENRRRFLNARSTLNCLLEKQVVPIINENDTVATEEIRYGDNDRLAARVAQLVMADGLILLSDVDGLYDSDPTVNAGAKLIPVVESIDDDILSIAGETRSGFGTGGMATKVQAARIATRAGCTTLITHGEPEQPLHRLAAGAACTVFPASETPASARKQWLAGALSVSGELRLDEGAANALADGSSLLPVGVVEVIGDFRRGDVVTLVDNHGNEIGRGLAEYSDADARLLAGCRSEEIQSKLGYRGRAVMVHRDEMVLHTT